MNFLDPTAVNTINQWVAKNTNNKITQIIDRIPPESVLYLINTIYLTGISNNEFDARATSDRSFDIKPDLTKTEAILFMGNVVELE